MAGEKNGGADACFDDMGLSWSHFGYRRYVRVRVCMCVYKGRQRCPEKRITYLLTYLTGPPHPDSSTDTPPRHERSPQVSPPALSIMVL